MGDQALHIILGNGIDRTTHQKALRLHQQLQKNPIQGVTEWVPTYQAVTLFYSPEIIQYDQLCFEVEKRWQQSKSQTSPVTTRRIDIPVLYGNQWGIDLEHVAEWNRLRVDEVIEIHSSSTYLVYMIGFTPGFPYLGGLSKRIATPRKKNPRTNVLSGSVGIADQQTGIYSLSTPGGWNIIGRTPIKLFDIDRSPPTLLQMGDQIRFFPITESEYHDIEHAIQEQSYTISIREVNVNDKCER